MNTSPESQKTLYEQLALMNKYIFLPFNMTEIRANQSCSYPFYHLE
jgi:hypothetical protein